MKNLTELKCPYCNTISDSCNFPDLFYIDDDNTPALNEQYALLQQLWNKGYNIVTCGDCGQVFIQEL